MEIKRIPYSVWVNEYTIYFSYLTHKGRYREQERILNAINRDQAKEEFEKWSKTVRTMTNVKILGIVKAENKGYYIDL